MSDIGNIDFLHFTVGNHQLICVLDLCWCVMCNADLSFEMILFSGHVIYLSLLARNREPFAMMNLRLDMATRSILLFPHEDENCSAANFSK